MLSLQLGLEAIEQIGVDASVDFLAENLLGALDGQHSHLLAQGFAGSNGLLLGYASLPPADIEAAMKLFGACLAELGLGRRQAA